MLLLLEIEQKKATRAAVAVSSGAHTVAAAAVREDGSEAHQLRRRWTHPGGSPRAAPGAHLALFLVHRD